MLLFAASRTSTDEVLVVLGMVFVGLLIMASLIGISIAVDKSIERRKRISTMMDQVNEMYGKLMAAKFIPDKESAKVADDQSN